MPLTKPVKIRRTQPGKGYRQPPPNMKCQPLTKTDFHDRLEELYADAAEADKALGRFIAKVCRHQAGAIAHASLKDPAGAEAKLGRSGQTDDPAILNDLVRATIYFDSIDQVYRARDYIVQNHASEIGLFFDRYQDSEGAITSVGANGYRDVKFILKLDIPRPNKFHYCELQLNLKALDRARPVDHAIYEIVRMAGSWNNRQPVCISDPKEKAVLAAKMRTAWVAIKRSKVGNSDDQARLQDLVFRFFEKKRGADIVSTRPVRFEVADIAFLDGFMPKVYQAYQDKALNATLMNGGVRRQALTRAQQQAFTRPT